MGDKKQNTDVDFITALAELLRTNDLTEIEVMREFGKDDVLNVRVARQMQAAAVVAAVPAAAPVAIAAAPAVASSVAAPAASADPAQLAGAVNSPMVGTAYLSAEPGADVFVKIGDSVKEGQTLLIIEAMKTMNQIPAPKSGKVTRILVDDGAPVEFGDPLIILE
ncbi:acetyl-CoA carboxylase, biotin carboxyl carrier protein [Rhodobacterales bacterium 52_120_T64]|nr:acetyl-CoA carboxylase, biotin carboxyl carrier protein [Rhodobacterales bacterium 52_120_T64]